MMKVERMGVGMEGKGEDGGCRRGVCMRMRVGKMKGIVGRRGRGI